MRLVILFLMHHCRSRGLSKSLLPILAIAIYSGYSIYLDTMGLDKDIRCTAETTLRVIGGRWKVMIVYHLFGRVLRFSALRKILTGCTAKMLTQQLREMERDGLVKRKVYAQVPPRVEYSLTPLGESLRPVVESMCRWGKLKSRACRFRNGE